MKSVITSIALVLLAMSAVWAGLAPGGSQIQAKTWFRYAYETCDGETEYSGFDVARGYFVWTHQFTDRIGSKFNIDVYSSDKDTDTKGAGLKIKAAYLEFKNLPFKDAQIQAGVIKNYFGTVYDWNYTTIQKALEDKEKVGSSADAGIALAGYIPSGFGEYHIGLYNGEGYSKFGSNINKYPTLGGNVRFIPIPGLTLGGSAQFTNDEETTIDTLGVETTKSWSIMKAAGVGRFAMGPVDLWGEFLMQKVDETTSQGFMIMPTVMLGKNLQILARYDNWDKDTENDDDAHSRMIVGLNWFISKNKNGKPETQIQVNWERKIPEAEGANPVDEFIFQLRWEFKSNAF